MSVATAEPDRAPVRAGHRLLGVDEAGLLRAGPARAELARAVLRRAEERTGTARWVPPVRAVPTPHRSPDELSSVGAREVPALPEVPEPEAGARLLPVPSDLAGLMPRGALVRGSTVVVSGSTSLVLALLAEASAAGGWVALVGLPEVGVLAAHELGLALDRVALVPAPGPDAPVAVAALLDGVDAVVVGPGAALSGADRRRLSARARERAAVLLSTEPWPGAHVVLTAQRQEWEGLGAGHGRLRGRRLSVLRTGRGAAAAEVRRDVVVPAGPGGPPPARAGTEPAHVVLRPGRRAG